MPLLTWTERYEPNTPDGSLKDCSYNAHLMLLVHGGIRDFPLGMYTWQQREAYEDASGLPESQQEKGTFGFGVCDHASQTLFGVTPRKAARTHLLSLLNAPGVAVAVQGSGAGLPSKYTGNHAVTCLNGRVYDPLYKSMSLGVPVNTSAIVAWNSRLRGAEIRWVEENEFVEVTMGTLSGYQSITPSQRVLDTRLGVGLVGKFVANTPRFLPLAGQPGVAVDSVAVVGNLTVTGQTSRGFLAVTQTPAKPTTSTLNFPIGDNRANGGVFDLVDGGLWVTFVAPTGSTCEVILDIGGVFVPLP